MLKLFDFFRPGRNDEAARRLYAGLVEQARRPGFYLACGVPDTADGRFDMILLHAFLLLRRLKRETAEAAALGQAVFDLMFADMDQNLREMGVGDLTVGKHVKSMVQAFYGRIAAYESGLSAAGDASLADALRRNLYRKAAPDDAAVVRVAGYLRREAASLDAQSIETLLAGEVRFGPAPTERAGDGQ